jgi:PAS domain S-box-containing protein
MPPDGKRERAQSPEIQSALDASGFIGTWENDLRADRVYLSGSLINLVGIAPERARDGVPLATFLAGIHPDDQDHVAELVHEAHGTAGRFAAQFRTLRADGAVHWVSARGQVEADAQGRGVRCLGMAVDITDARADEAGDCKRIEVIERLVDSLIALRKLVACERNEVLGTLIDMLLFELGNELSQSAHEAGARRIH